MPAKIPSVSSGANQEGRGVFRHGVRAYRYKRKERMFDSYRFVLDCDISYLGYLQWVKTQKHVLYHLLSLLFRGILEKRVDILKSGLHFFQEIDNQGQDSNKLIQYPRLNIPVPIISIIVEVLSTRYIRGCLYTKVL